VTSKPNDFATRILFERMRFGFSLREVAKATGISPTTLHKWETGRSVPQSGWRIRRLAEIYHVTPLYLLTGENE
jgi:transcriptional regulator with XRE-family HTH domain